MMSCLLDDYGVMEQTYFLCLVCILFMGISLMIADKNFTNVWKVKDGTIPKKKKVDV